ncbi:unnamed protein product, partial [Closterium sp. NIES-54]
DAMVTTTTSGGQRVSICTCTRTGRHLATFTRRSGSSLYTHATEPPQVAASAQVSTSGQVAASCSCRLLSHQTLLWHHRLGHPSLPRLRGMHSCRLVSGLPRSLPPLPPSPAPPCLPCVEGRQRTAPHSSSFPLRTAPLQTLHMDDLLVLRLHSDIGGEFSSNLLRDFCHREGILQSFTLPDSPHQNAIAERRIGLVMEVARTSMIHAAIPHFLWPFAVQYAALQLNLWPRVSLPETSPTLRWTGEVGDASVFRFYHPTSRRVLPSEDVTFDKSVPFYRLFPYRSARPPPPPLFVAPGPPPVDPLPPQGPAPSGVSRVDPLPGTALVDEAVGSGAACGGATSGGAEPGCVESEGAESGDSEPRGEELGGAEPASVEPGGAKLGGAEPGGAESEGAKSGGAEPRGATSSGGPAGASPRVSLQQLREWLFWRARLRSGATGAGGAGDARAGGTAGTAAASLGGSRTRDAGAAGSGGVGGAGAGDPTEPGAAGAGALALVALALEALELEELTLEALAQEALELVLGVPSFTSLTPPLLCPPPDHSQLPLQPASPLRAPSPYTEQSGGLTERREPVSRPVSPVRTARRVPRSRPPPVPGTHVMALRPSSVPLRVPLPTPPESSLPEVPDPESDRACAASPTVSRLLATAVIDPSFESALVAELLDFAAACRLDYATALIAESSCASPPSVGDLRQSFRSARPPAAPQLSARAAGGGVDNANSRANKKFSCQITVL